MTDESDEEEVDEIEREAKKEVKESKDSAWQKYLAPIQLQVSKTIDLLNSMANGLPENAAILKRMALQLSANREPLRRDVMKA